MENEAQDVESYEDRVEVFTTPEQLSQVAAAFENAQVKLSVNEVIQVPQTTVDVDEALHAKPKAARSFGRP